MAVNPVLWRFEGAVASIALNRPDRRNAVDGVTAQLLHEALLQATRAPECRVIVLSGAGPSFCAGWDTDAIAALQAADEASVRAEFEANRRLLADLASAPQVTVAKAHGAVLGFGIGLIAACDIAVAGRSTSIGLPEVALGIVPGMVMLDVLEALPAKLALDWLLSAGKHDAEEALRAGLVSRVVDDERLDEEVGALAARLAGLDPGTVQETKRMFRLLGTLDRAAAEDAAIDAAVRALVRD